VATTSEVLARVDALQSDLERLDALCELKDDWNSYGSAAITSDAIAAARRILFAVALNDALGAYDRARPYTIAPLAHGGIHLEWRHSGEELTVEVFPAGATGILAIQIRDGVEVPHDEDAVSLETILSWLNRIMADQ
jgi:hypothetical protein